MTKHNTAAWRRSTFCGTGACVEVSTTADRQLMRDAKEQDGAILAFSHAAWGTFVSGVRNGNISAG